VLCFGSVHCKGIAGAFCVSADSAGLSDEMRGSGWAGLKVVIFEAEEAEFTERGKRELGGMATIM
jgi:hypothetical protein